MGKKVWTRNFNIKSLYYLENKFECVTINCNAFCFFIKTELRVYLNKKNYAGRIKKPIDKPRLR